MRKIGTLPSAALAERFQNYLSGLGVENRVDAADNVWEIWVFREDQVERAREELPAFEANSTASRYDAKPVVLKAPVKPSKRTGEQEIHFRGAATPQATMTLVLIAIIVAVFTGFNRNVQLIELLKFTPIGGDLSNILSGEVWRIYTPMFLHANIFHLGMNVFMLWILGTAIERVYGTRYFVVQVLLIGLVSHFAQYWLAGGNFGGLSGVVYGLFGFLWMRSLFLPSDGFYMPQSIVFQMILWAIIGLSPTMHIANGAHFGGLFAGMLLGALPRLWRK
ncbi:rhomboid family intramembrane serine protease [Planctomicrobium sp. SH668]|uniref:rhomboid family intramembrane serine protease n=1 Tax=Planctomicrobium sp. SH668 TaxID=3448126 RepID=UPI003F5C8793